MTVEFCERPLTLETEIERDRVCLMSLARRVKAKSASDAVWY
jgi:hypothetical protein